MSEELLETPELRERLEEAIERLEHVESESSAGWLRYLSLTTAIIAVFAAIASLQSGAYSNDALLEKNEALLAQSKASDQWAYYQAKGIKGALANSQAEALTESQPNKASKFAEESNRYKAEQKEIQTKAKELEEDVEHHNKRSEELLEAHHRCAMGVTFFQVSIALGAIAALQRRRYLWFLGLAAGFSGLILTAIGLIHT